MKKFFWILLGLTLSVNGVVKADEGMWLLPLIQKLNIDTMHALGFKLSAEDIYSINHSSLKDAIVMFGAGCTAEVVSEDGLLLTNHHCGYDAIQNHSTVEHNYLEDGFWASDRTKELPNDNLSVTFLVRIEDVTTIMIKGLSDTLSEDERDEKADILSDSIRIAAIAGTNYKAAVKSLFGGNNYYLFVYEVYTDVRLVGAPPSSIGKFGYDTDNWMWPRHTADFSVFRIYAGNDGKPAAYSKSNVPLKPRKALTVSLEERKVDDFAMVLGYPGTTNRYMTSYQVNEVMNITNPNRIKIRGLRQEILLKEMLADEKVNIQYASKYHISSNYWKFSVGQNQVLKRLHIVEEKENQEKEFTDWVNADRDRIAKYSEALSLIKKAVDERAVYKHTLQYTYECFFLASEIVAMANKASGLYNTLLGNPSNKDLISSMASVLKSQWEEFLPEYNVNADRNVVSAMLQLYRENIAPEYLPDFYKIIESKYKNDYQKYTADLFEKSMFVNPSLFEAFLKNPTSEALARDPAFQMALSANVIYRKVYYSDASLDIYFNEGNRLYIAGLKEMHPEKTYYPDANSTMRMSYGTVQGYQPRDAVYYNYFTTIEGIMEKEDPGNWEFLVPQKLKDLYEKKDYGIYGINNSLPVCFITNNDITGGNSGSPVMDGNGNLIGLAFDGNWESMSGDIAFEPELQRCICVDIRYVLFIMDKYANASHLVKEMKIVR
jgi:hypothetical protein